LDRFELYFHTRKSYEVLIFGSKNSRIQIFLTIEECLRLSIPLVAARDLSVYLILCNFDQIQLLSAYFHFEPLIIVQLLHLTMNSWIFDDIQWLDVGKKLNCRLKRSLILISQNLLTSNKTVKVNHHWPRHNLKIHKITSKFRKLTSKFRNLPSH